MSALVTDSQRIALAVKNIKTGADLLWMAAEDAAEEGVDFERIKPVLEQARRDLDARWNDLRDLVNP